MKDARLFAVVLIVCVLAVFGVYRAYDGVSEREPLAVITAEQCKQSPQCSAEVQKFGRETYNMGMEAAGKVIARICLQHREFQVDGQRFTCQKLEELPSI